MKLLAILSNVVKITIIICFFVRLLHIIKQEKSTKNIGVMHEK